jgi:hypothetical protein
MGLARGVMSNKDWMGKGKLQAYDVFSCFSLFRFLGDATEAAV